VKLDSNDGLAFLLVDPKDFDGVEGFRQEHSNRLVGFGEIQLDHPKALEQIDRFHAAGFRGLGGDLRPQERTTTLTPYVPRFTPAPRNTGMMILFHTGIGPTHLAEIPADISVDRMRARRSTTSRRYPKSRLSGRTWAIRLLVGGRDRALESEYLLGSLGLNAQIKKQEDYTFFKSIFWWSGIASPHSPKNRPGVPSKGGFGS
jgi:hypothetical protein